MLRLIRLRRNNSSIRMKVRSSISSSPSSGFRDLSLSFPDGEDGGDALIVPQLSQCGEVKLVLKFYCSHHRRSIVAGRTFWSLCTNFQATKPCACAAAGLRVLPQAPTKKSQFQGQGFNASPKKVIACMCISARAHAHLRTRLYNLLSSPATFRLFSLTQLPLLFHTLRT